MMRSDGNGAYIVDKKLWGLLIALIIILCGLVAYGAQGVVGDVKDIREAVSGNDKGDAARDVEIRVLKEAIARFEAKLDKVLSK